VSEPLPECAPPAGAVRHAERVVGRARVVLLEDGAELWRFADPGDPAVARLRAWGPMGLGGFVAAGRDEHGAWLWRPPAPLRLDAWSKAGPHPWVRVRPVIVALVERLAWCEAQSLFPGSLVPGEVVVDEATSGVAVVLRAEALVRGLVGAVEATGTGSPGLSRWVPPEQAQAAGAWDGAANRYVVGLVLYRALTGHHPFAGQGLRRGLDEQARQGAPPLPDDVAAGLPPGVQSLCLQLLDPDPARRLASMAGLRERLAGLVEGAPPSRMPAPQGAVVRARTVGGGPGGPAARAVAPALIPPPARTPSPWWGRLALAVPVVAGLGLAVALSGVVEPPKAAVAPRVGAAAPLGLDQTSADDCAACHPRQVAQWTQSVMAHSAKSPLFQALEILIEEQVGKDLACPQGAGILRKADPRTACRDRDSGLPVTGSGGEHWCVNCHTAGENLRAGMPAWDGRAGRSGSRQPLRDLMPAATMEGIGCAVCHTAHGPARPGRAAVGAYEGNPDWISFVTGQRFSARPEDGRGLFGIANSGYDLDPAVLLADRGRGGASAVPGGAHLRPEAATREYLRTSEFCGACHDVRLFGTDVVGGRDRGEHFKRLRNAYSEWARWADDERRAGREPASCQDCHMSEYPGVCVPTEGDDALAAAFVDGSATALRRGCPPGTRFEPRAPGRYPEDRPAIGSGAPRAVTTHWFSGVDVPLSPELGSALIDDPTLDEAGMPRGLRPRRDLLLGRTFRFAVVGAARRGGTLEIPIELENTGAGHRVPAGFSQEREFWVHLQVTDADGRLVYEVGRVERGDEDLHDKEFVRVNVDDRFVDEDGRPLGVFGADVADGRDVPEWSPNPLDGGTRFRGKGLMNLQNGFLRCVKCIGVIDAFGRCQPGFGQGRFRADRFDDGAYDLDTGECISNLVGAEALLETYFPVGGLDASRGVTKGPDAIIDSRSAPPGVTLQYTYELPARGAGPFVAEARLMFRAFPPFLVRAFADYEALQAARGLRPSGPLVTHDMLDRLEAIELHRVRVEIP
jgi:eukaryotic-like serine/threonine-protein kinase